MDIRKKYFRNQRLDNCFISLHLNEKEHPHFHIIGPKKLSLGKNFKGLEKNIHEIAINHNVVTPEMEYALIKIMRQDYYQMLKYEVNITRS